nr:MAG TPA: hypothetical protein [Caudoviricetes sp.]DAW23381.1 MAG TPA: hypothetical protein [Caudoviricetes sp.]
MPSNPPQSIWPHHAHGSGRKARTFPQKIQRARQRPARFLKMASKCYHLTVF